MRIAEVYALITIVSISALPPATAQAQESASTEAEVATLKERVASLEAALAELREQLSADKRATPEPDRNTASPVSGERLASAPPVAANVPAASASANRTGASAASPVRDTFGDELTGVARPDNAPPPNNPELRGFIPIPGTQTMLKLGGFAKVNAIYDFSPAGNADKLVPATIPVDGSRGRNMNVDANATRFSFEVRRPSSLGTLRFYLENDFYGGSGVTAFRLRQAHGQVGNIYAGYGYSAFIDSDAYPETLDDEGPAGEALLRLAALRYLFKIGDGLTATLSVEKPSSDMALPTGAMAEQPMPDVVGALRLQRDWGHLQGAAVIRRIGYRLDGDARTSLGYGLNLSGLASLGDDFAMASFTYGQGIARYVNDLGGRGLDALAAPDGSVETLATYAGYVGYTHHWSKRWRSNLVGSLVQLERDPRLPQTAFRSSTYGATNLILQASPNFSLGVEALYGRHELQNGQSADVVRLQTSFKYDFVR